MAGVAMVVEATAEGGRAAAEWVDAVAGKVAPSYPVGKVGVLV